MPTTSLHAIAELGRRALTGSDLPHTIADVLALAERELALDRCDVLLVLPEGTAHMVAARGDGEPLAEESSPPIDGSSPAGRVLRTLTPLVIANASDDPCAGSTPYRAGMESSLLVPLFGRDRPLGVFGAHTRQRRTFRPDEVDLLQVLANQLSAAWQRHSLADERREKNIHRAEQMMAIGQVAAGVAHELRNPLTSIKGLIQVNLREAAARGLPVEDLSIIEHEIRRMERTLQTFLDFARPPKPDRKPLDLRDIVQRVASLVAGRSRKQHVELRSLGEAPVIVAADQDQLQQLLLNLMLNSLDAMPEGGVIEVEVRAPRDGWAELVLRDSGPGIPADVLPKVFETFVSSKETGVGLGLPVSKRIAEDHGGTLHAFNLPGGGACFVLRLPCPESLLP